MFNVKIQPSQTALDKLAQNGPQLIEKLLAKMNVLMFKLAAKIIQEEIPIWFPNGAPNIAASVRSVPAQLDGTKIRGTVEAGGPKTTVVTKGGPNAGQSYDYAFLQEMGVAHTWEIQPVLFNSAWALNPAEKIKSRALSVGGLPQALAFTLNGKLIIVRSVMHPGLKSRPFMRQGLYKMQAQIISEMEATITEALP